MQYQNDLEIALNNLRDLLQRRSSIVADSELLARDPEEHLRQLKTVSQRLFDAHKHQAKLLPSRLNHFLDSGSYGKALGHINAMLS